MDKPLLHLVFGGEVKDPQGFDFVNTEQIDIRGIFPDHKSAMQAWRGASQAHVDQANFKYVIVHLHRLLDPEHPVDFHERRSDRRGGDRR